jgi:NAD(P)-dependent dehydrogenase (short-subunit alcohol dehydrogenase family)
MTKLALITGASSGIGEAFARPRTGVACLSRMAAEAQIADAGYTNRPPIHAQALWRARLENHAGRHATGRSVDRMLLALRAYEQRAQRKAAFEGWLIARRGLTSRT